MIRILDHKDAAPLLARKTERLEDAERVVRSILEDVRRRGDAALLEYARKFDGFEGASVRVEPGGTLGAEFERGCREYSRVCLPATPAGTFR
jgi:histidinol dehydrogenase